MKDVSGNCSIPFGLFGSKAPDHVITSIEIISNKFIITGDEIGQIVIWKINSLVDISIHWYLIGHSSQISNICRISTNDSDDRYFVSFSVSREIAVWNCVDGRCVKFDRSTSADHLSVLSYKPASRASALLLCCGRYAGVLVMDALSLSTTMQLRSRGYPNWIQSLCAFEHQQAGVHVVLGLSVAGAAILWTIDTLDSSIKTQVIYETESRLLMLASPVSISMCSAKPRFVLVTSASAAQIYDAANWTLLCQTSAKENSCFTSGKFLDAKTVLLQLKNGCVYLYNVPFPLDTPLIARNDFPMDLSEVCVLGYQGDNSRCHTVCMERNELTVLFGHSCGLINVWRSHLSNDDQAAANDQVSTSLSFSLETQWSQKNFLSITDPLDDLGKVTCCHYTRTINSVVLGMDNGDIIIADLLHTVCVTLFPKYTSSLSHVVLHGHRLSVLALLYDEMTSGDKKTPCKWLWSGAADYSVRLWDLDARSCVRIFDCHSGPVKFIVKGPMLGVTRSKHEGHIRAQKNKENVEQEVLKPINNDSWIGTHLYVSTDGNNSIAFLSLETRRVVLRMQFSSEILTVGWRREHTIAMVECADGSVTVWELGASEMDRCVSGQTAKDIFDSSTDKIVFRNLTEFPSITASVSDRLKRNGGSALMLHHIPSGLNGRNNYILTVDTEALLVELFSRLHGDSNSNNNITSTPFIEAQLLLTLVNQWGSDVCLDKTLESSLGLVPVSGAVSSGHFSSRFGTVSFRLQLRRDEHSLDDGDNNPILCSQQLLAAVAICHALNNLPEKQQPGQHAWARLVSCLAAMNTTPALAADQSKTNAADSRTTMRQVCCLFATSLVTFALPRLLRGTVPHTQLVLQQFLQKYQDRCLEIREAARTLFHASMDCLHSDQRTEIVQTWVVQSRVLEFTDELPERVKDLHRSSLSSVHDMPAIVDWRSSWALAELYEPKEVARMQVITIAFLAAVGARYGSLDSHTPLDSNTVSPVALKHLPTEKTIPGFGIDDYRLARITCSHLMRLLSQVQSGGVTWPEMRRLAITLLGQGFPVWEPYLEVGTLFSRLLEVVSGSEKLLSNWSPGQLLTDEMDAARSAKSALLAIALSRPKVFATVLSIDVLRLQQTQASVNSVSSHQTVIGNTSNGPQSVLKGTGTGMGIGISANATTATTATAPNQTQPPLLAARHEVIDVIKVLCERKTREMHDVFPEIMDVLLACLNKLELRQFDLQQLFPPILLFRIASSHTASGKVCVGTRTGQVVFYDVKLGKYNTSPGHKSAVTSVTFSPDGKQVASYSMPDNSVCIWQLFSSGLFGMGSSHQVKLASTLNVPPVAVSQTVSEEDSSLLLWLEWYENRSIHLVTNAGLVNKIKL